MAAPSFLLMTSVFLKDLEKDVSPQSAVEVVQDAFNLSRDKNGLIILAHNRDNLRPFVAEVQRLHQEKTKTLLIEGNQTSTVETYISLENLNAVCKACGLL